MRWLRLILASYAALSLAGLGLLKALGLLEPLALQWTALQVAVGLGLGLMIALAGDDAEERPRRLGHRPR
jgi:hypothetical protein